MTCVHCDGEIWFRGKLGWTHKYGAPCKLNSNIRAEPDGVMGVSNTMSVEMHNSVAMLMNGMNKRYGIDKSEWVYRHLE